jgi:sulfur carrier protein ThiS adenylyltransferase
MNEFEQALVQKIGTERLRKIQSVKIGIAGAGGLGSNCAVHLVRTGFKNFTLVDFDILDYSNLNRQYYFNRQVGRAKVDVLAENLLDINSAVMIEKLCRKLEEPDFAEIFMDCHVIVEAFDQAKYKKLLVERFIDTNKLLVCASGLAGFESSDAIVIHQLRERFFMIGDLKTSVGAETPPLAPRVAVAAAKQADVILRYVLENSSGEEMSC